MLADASQSAPSIQPQRILKRILIVRPTALGDVGRTVPVLVSLHQAFPDARIDWLVAETFADAVAHHPMLDRVVSFARDRLAHMGWRPSAMREGLALAKRLRQERYDRVYDCQGLFRSGLMTWLTRAPHRVGFADAREGAWLAYNLRYRIEPGITHTVDRMLALVQADGIEPCKDMQLYVGPLDQAWLRQFVHANGIGQQGYACIAPTAKWGCKCWPMERYAQIAKRLLETRLAGRHLVVLAAPHEQAQVRPLLETLANQGIDVDRYVIFPPTSVGRMMALISQTRLMVCNDSAALHMAVGFNKPIATIFVPTDPAYVGPYQREECVIRPAEAKNQVNHYRRHLHDQSLIARVEVEAVWEKIQEQMATAGATVTE